MTMFLVYDLLYCTFYQNIRMHSFNLLKKFAGSCLPMDTAPRKKKKFAVKQYTVLYRQQPHTSMYTMSHECIIFFCA